MRFIWWRRCCSSPQNEDFWQFSFHFGQGYKFFAHVSHLITHRHLNVKLNCQCNSTYYILLLSEDDITKFAYKWETIGSWMMIWNRAMSLWWRWSWKYKQSSNWNVETQIISEHSKRIKYKCVVEGFQTRPTIKCLHGIL